MRFDIFGFIVVLVRARWSPGGFAGGCDLEFGGGVSFGFGDLTCKRFFVGRKSGC